MTTVEQIFLDTPEWAEARRIRIEVFVDEQQVPFDEEIDEFEPVCHHFLARVDGMPAGTCRWRYTDKGIKMERFAVDARFRGAGVGSALLKAALADVEAQPQSKGRKRYLHSQVSAMFLYEKFGFEKEGEQFDECGIMHYKMVKA